MNESGFGNLAGTVVDAQGTALPGAIVTATGPGGPHVRGSNGDGEFSFNEIEVGSYTVEAKLGGFQTVIEQGVGVYLLQTTQIQLTVTGFR